MGAKTFRNSSPYQMAVTLTVRQGDTPGKEAGIMTFALGPNQSQWVNYSGDDNPYLDAIAVMATTPNAGGIVAAQDIVLTRGSQIDNEFNTNNQVNIAVNGASIVLSFANA